LDKVQPKCPNESCSRSPSERIVRDGYYYRKDDRIYVQRFRCAGCQKRFSNATPDPCFGQHKRRINRSLAAHLSSGVSMRRAALLLGVTLNTVARKLSFLGQQFRRLLELERTQQGNVSEIEFDELETYEHSRLKPLSVVAAVVPGRRKILGFEVASMPAKGLVAEKARMKYGYRKDTRTAAIRRLFADLQLHHPTLLRSDDCPRYPSQVRRAFPKATHIRIQGGRAGPHGLGELRQKGFDPIFSINHTFAMFRANVNRLFRRSWCTTKKANSLADHLAIYAHFHNTVLTRNAQ
jgi:transposase-like protein